MNIFGGCTKFILKIEIASFEFNLKIFNKSTRYRIFSGAYKNQKLRQIINFKNIKTSHIII